MQRTQALPFSRQEGHAGAQMSRVRGGGGGRGRWGLQRSLPREGFLEETARCEFLGVGWVTGTHGAYPTSTCSLPAKSWDPVMGEAVSLGTGEGCELLPHWPPCPGLWVADGTAELNKLGHGHFQQTA